MDKKTVYLKITGRVQGVFYRASAQKEALRLHLTGWVKNTDDFVEAMVSGDAAAVALFIEWAHVGPERAQVNNVFDEELDYKAYDGFAIVRGN